MMVYGDMGRGEDAAAVAASIAGMLGEAAAAPVGVDRHAMVVRAFIRAGELVQGIADAEFERLGRDARSRLHEAGASLLLALATAIDRSWRHDFRCDLDIDFFADRLRELAGAGRIETRNAEGYAHYALYPESYLEAARASGLRPETCVIGLRSIGTGLAALVAAALNARPAIDLRPVGHPFDREIRAGTDILGADPANPDVHFAIVDEGPGLSGSSFASVAKWLLASGATCDRIHFFPSHAGEPGDAASAETRSIWRRCRRHTARSDRILSGRGGLTHWIESRVGVLDEPLLHYPVNAGLQRDMRFEKPKFMARSGGRSWLVKFAGLGETGLRKLRDARALARGGFGPRTDGLCYGFLVQEHLDAEALHVAGRDQRRFLGVLASYLAFRAGSLGPAGPGASMAALRSMAVENTRRSLGEVMARKLDQQLFDIDRFSATVRRVRTDNRLHAWEWLVAGDRFVKTDAVDHCEGHDLIGCQDIAWDMAGAIAEHDLTAEETDDAIGAVRAAGASVDAGLVAAMLPCYLAFQIGLWATAPDSAAASQADRYARKLADLLGRV